MEVHSLEMVLNQVEVLREAIKNMSPSSFHLEIKNSDWLR